MSCTELTSKADIFLVFTKTHLCCHSDIGRVFNAGKLLFSRSTEETVIQVVDGDDLPQHPVVPVLVVPDVLPVTPASSGTPVNDDVRPTRGHLSALVFTASVVALVVYIVDVLGVGP